jgi:hypothetical protein
MSIVLNSSGGGSVTINEPTTASNFTQTLPAATGTLVVSGTTPSLNGITFPATQSASADANTLDDYEEGTWTPLISANGTGTDNFTSSTATGRYTKIGRLVTIECIYTYTAKQSSSSSYALGSGIPFSSANTGGFFYVGINNPSGADTATYSGVIAGASILFVKDQNQTGASYMLGGDFPAATRTVTFQATYTV